jgi:adenosylcobinamide-GDP ribazoletransferase
VSAPPPLESLAGPPEQDVEPSRAGGFLPCGSPPASVSGGPNPHEAGSACLPPRMAARNASFAHRQQADRQDVGSAAANAPSWSLRGTSPLLGVGSAPLPPRMAAPNVSLAPCKGAHPAAGASAAPFAAREPLRPAESRVGREWQALLAAILFYTRVPVPVDLPHAESLLNRATAYLPLIGGLLGAVTAAVALAAGLLWPPAVAVWLAMTVGVLLTGAFHEDGFADACDGFGGGWERDRILTIMKDSRIGAFGAFGTWFLLSGKFLALCGLVHHGGAFALAGALIAGQAVSRWVAVTIVWRSAYVRGEAGGKAKPLATGLSGGSMGLATVFGGAPLALLPWPAIGLGLAAVFLVGESARRYFDRHLGGYTGDCLGAAQQAAELVFYLAVLATVPG